MQSKIDLRVIVQLVHSLIGLLRVFSTLDINHATHCQLSKTLLPKRPSSCTIRSSTPFRLHRMFVVVRMQLIHEAKLTDLPSSNHHQGRCRWHVHTPLFLQLSRVIVWPVYALVHDNACCKRNIGSPVRMDHQVRSEYRDLE